MADEKDKKVFNEVKKEMEKRILDIPEDEARKALLAYLFNAESLLKEFFPDHVELYKQQGLMRR